MEELTRYCQSTEMLVQYSDGRLSYLPKLHQFAVNLKTGSIAMTKSLSKSATLQGGGLVMFDSAWLSSYVQKIAGCLDKLKKRTQGDIHINMTLNLRFCDMSFSNGIRTHYSQRVGRLAVCSNGEIKHSDFGFTSNFQELYYTIEQSYLAMTRSLMAGSKQLAMSPPNELNRILILKPQAAAYFIHEIVGHIFEYDNWNIKEYELDTNQRFLPKGCNIIDDPINSTYLAYGEHDDVGKKTEIVTVIEDGYFKNHISMCRSAEYTQQPLYRMSNFSLAGNPLGRSFLEMKASYKDYVVIEEISNGGINPYTGDFFISCTSQYYGNSNGEENRLAPCTYYGKVHDLNRKIIEIGSDFSSFIGICSKSRQSLFVSSGAPSIVISPLNIVV